MSELAFKNKTKQIQHCIISLQVINANIPKVPWLTGYLAILFGAGATIVVQSSSIFTSTLTPLVGVGLIKLERMYPLTLGSNIGTTATGVMAALVADSDAFRREMQVAMVHLFFNISGILMWYPIPFLRKIPIAAAKYLGNTTAEYRWFAVVYLIMMFFVFPAIVFGLSLAGWYVLVAVGGPILIIAIFVAVVNALQNTRCKLCCKSKSPGFLLPHKLRTWDFLPLCLRSWDPLDRVLTAACRCCKCCQKQKDDSAEMELEKGAKANGVVTGEENPAFSDPGHI